MSGWQSVWQIVALAAVVLLLVVLFFWAWSSISVRFRLARSRREFELMVIHRQIAKINQDPDSIPQAINDLRSLGSIPAASAATATASSGGAASVMRQLTTFPEGAGIAQLGYRIFKWLLVLALVMTICLIIYGWATYPSEAEVAAVVGGQSTVEARTDAYTQLLAAWQQQLKDLGQLFLLTPVFPLIGTVIGYIFGVRRSNGQTDPNTRGGVAAPDPSTTTPPGKQPVQATP